MKKNVAFTDRNGATKTVTVIAEEKRSGFKTVSCRCDDLRGAVAKLWTDGHVGTRHTAISRGNAALVIKGKCQRIFQGHRIGARLYYKINKSNPQPKLFVPLNKFEETCRLVEKLQPQR